MLHLQIPTKRAGLGVSQVLQLHLQIRNKRAGIGVSQVIQLQIPRSMVMSNNLYNNIAFKALENTHKHQIGSTKICPQLLIVDQDLCYNLNNSFSTLNCAQIKQRYIKDKPSQTVYLAGAALPSTSNPCRTGNLEHNQSLAARMAERKNLIAQGDQN